MNALKGFSTPLVKVKEIREMIDSGKFAGWVEKIERIRAQLRGQRENRLDWIFNRTPDGKNENART